MAIAIMPDMDVGWIHPWVGLGWVALGRKFSRFGGLGWVGFIYAQSKRDLSSVGRTITDASARLSAAKVEAIELVRWGLRASLISSSS